MNTDKVRKVGVGMKHTFLGIDLGTSAMKLVLTDEYKNVLEQITEEYEVVQSDGGWREINPEIWFECMKHGIRRILHKQDGKNIRAIGITGQMHTLVVVDRDGKPVRPAMMWNDTRTKELLPELKEKVKSFPGGEYLSRTISTGSPAANLYWMSLYEPENLEKIHKFMIGPDFLVFRMTGECGTDYCEASTSCLYQIYERKWSEEIRNLIGLSEDVYPVIRGSAMSAGRLLPEMAAELEVNPEAEVIVGTGDNPATAISTGCLGLGYPVISLGTSGVFMMPVEEPESQAKGKMILFSFDNKSFSYLVQGAVQCNGNTFDWWSRDIMGRKNFEELTNTLDVKRASENQLLFYPHLGGDKTIYADPDMRGAFVGLGIDTSYSDMFYAVIEGLCFGFRELAEKMRLPLERYGSVKVVGGGAKSPVWMQTMANVLNIRIEKLDGMIGPAFGIALLATYQGGYISSLEQISEGTVKIERCFEPDVEAAARCDKKYEKYLRIRNAMKYISEGTL